MAIADVLEPTSVRFFGTDTSYVKIFAVVAAVFLLTHVFMTYDNIYPGFEIIGSNRLSLTYTKAKSRFQTQGKSLIFQGLQKFNGRPFQIIATNGPQIIVPTTYARFIGADQRFSFYEFIKREFFRSYPGFEGFQADESNTVARDVVRTKLTQSLGLITRDLCEETEASLKDIFGENKDWVECHFQKIAPELVARLSTRVFLGPVLARSKAWLKIAETYTINVILATRALKRCPAALRPIAHRLIPECRALAVQSKQAHDIITAEIRQRKAKWEEDRANGIPVSKIADSLGWMQELGGKRPSDLQVAGAQLGLTFAAIHTTSDLLVKAMYRACADPECVGALRSEMIEIIGQEGWKKTSLYKLKLLDSFLKEVLRLEPVSLATMNRVATTSINLDDGSVIPRGANVKVFADSHFDPKVYPEPEHFDPHRYLKLRNQPDQENNWHLVSVSPESVGFGLGKHACPGRFFASNEIKIALCFLLLKYDWKMLSVPKRIEIGTEVVADPSVKLAYRRRNEELDLSSF